MKKILFLISILMMSCGNIDSDIAKACEISCKNFENTSKLKLMSLKFSFDKKENKNIETLKNEIELNLKTLIKIRSKYVGNDDNVYDQVPYDQLLIEKCKGCYTKVTDKYDLSDEGLSKEILSLKSYILKDISENGYKADSDFKTMTPVNSYAREYLNITRKDSFYTGQNHKIISINLSLDSKEDLLAISEENLERDQNIESSKQENIEAYENDIKELKTLLLDDNIILYSGLIKTENNGLNFFWSYDFKFDNNTNEWNWSRELIVNDHFPYEPPTSPKLIADELGEFIAAEITNEYWGVDYDKSEVEFDFTVESYLKEKYNGEVEKKYRGIIDLTHMGQIGSMYPRNYQFGVHLEFKYSNWNWKLVEFQ